VSLRLKSLRPALIFRPAGRPIVLPEALPTVPRVAAFGSRTPATFSADRLVVLLVPIVLPIRELDFTVRERRSVADCLFVIETDGSFLPITLPMFRLRSVRSDDWLLFTLDEVEGLVELTAGCLATVGAEELRVPIELPIRERWLVVGCFLAFEADGVLRLLELPIREDPLELAAGCLAPLGTDGLVVSIVLPIREVMLGLIRLLVLVVGLLVVVVREGLLDGVLILIELPIRDDMLELILPFELLRLDVLVLGVRLVMDLLDMLLLGALLVMDLLELLLLGVRLVVTLLELLLLGVRLAVTRLELRLDETLLELLEEVDLDVALGAGAGFEACRLCLLELLDFVLLDCVLAANTGSAISARISTKST
jgi:hypothetical protein